MMATDRKIVHIAPLVVFRITLGMMLLFSIIRFWTNGWIEELYIKPSFYFSYYGLEWVKPVGSYTYVLFALCALSALFVAIGFFYRISSIVLFLSFTYIELMDKTTYLNHYYFVSVVCFIMMFLPANASFSVDAWRRKRSYSHVPSFTINSIRVVIAILYIFAGVAKINSDWLIEAQPLRTWLPAKNNLPLIGDLFNEVWVAYLFSWFGCFYDLTIPLWLSIKRTRLVAFCAVVVFHVLTAILFPIGMFPYVMIVSSLIFFPASFHIKVIERIGSFFRIRKPYGAVQATFTYPERTGVWLRLGLVVFLLFQLVIPFRYTLYPGELFWTEEGYRFSWRVMLMEKTGYTVFTVRDDAAGKKEVIENHRYLTLLQEKQMSFQPDMILEFAHFLANEYTSRGWKSPEVYVTSYVSLNGRASKLFIDPAVNLAAEKESFKHKQWVLPLNDEISGF